MKTILKLISFAALAAVLIAPICHLAGSLARAPMNATMLVGTLLWFATTPFWMDRKA